MKPPAPPFIHPSAVVDDGASIGGGTKVWHFTHVREDVRIGTDCQLGQGVYVDPGVVIGDRCRIQNHVSVFAGVELGDDVFVGPSAVFTNDLWPRAGNEEWVQVPTRVESGASIGANATIVCGVTIGAWAMIGAGSVVTRDVEAHSLVAGVPARAIGWVCRCGQRLAGRPAGDACPHRR